MPTNQRTPDRIAYTIAKGKRGKKDYWCHIGAGWINKDRSITVKLNALPLNGEIILQIPETEDTTQES